MPVTPRGSKKGSAAAAESGGGSNNVKVMTRCRLFNERELKSSAERKEELLPVVRMKPNGDVELHELYKVEGGPTMGSKVVETFSFDHAFWSMPASQAECAGCPYATQQDVFLKSGAVATAAAFDGFNSCIFAYGQTGSGKTYTMLGSTADPGVCPRVVDDVFCRMDKVAAEVENDDGSSPLLTLNKCELELTFYEIYMENVRDLFNESSALGTYEKPRVTQGPFGVTVNGLVRKKPKNGAQAKKWMLKAMEERTTAPTAMNPFSSRSHAVFQLHLTQIDGETGMRKRSTINLVDLAGSEKLKQSKAEDFTAKQAIMINKSLFTLRSVIDALVAKSNHIPLRESVLTFTLSDALGGNSKTQMIAAVSPHSLNFEDSKHTLQYAMKAKKMVTKPTVNQESSEVARLQQAKLIEDLKRQLAEGAFKAAVLPEGMVPMTPKEVQEQIQEQEAKMQEFEVETQNLKIEYKQKEEKHKVLMLEKQKLLEKAQVDAKLRKQEQFRKAFQNAFKITKEKQTTAALRAELEDVQAQKAELIREQAEADAKKMEAEGKSAALRGAIDVMERQFKDQKKQETLTLEKHANELAKVREEKMSLAVAADRREEKIATLEHQVAKLSALLDIGTTEKDRLKQDWEAEALKQHRKNASLKSAVDLYKSKATMEETRAVEMRGVFDSQRDDHKTMLQTIVNQQKMIQQLQDAALSQNDNKRKQDYSVDQDGEALRHYKQLAADQQRELASLTAKLTHYEMQNFELMQQQRNNNSGSFHHREDSSLSPHHTHHHTSLSPRHSGGGAGRGKSPSAGRHSPTRVSHHQDPAQGRWNA